MNVIEALEYCLEQFKTLDKSSDREMGDGDLARNIAEKAIPGLEAVLAQYHLPVGADRAVCNLHTVANTGYEGMTQIEDVTPDHYGRIISAMHRRDNSMETSAVLFNSIRKLMGYVEDSSDQTVRLFQDDATKEYFVYIRSMGKDTGYSAATLGEAIAAALKGEGHA